MEYRAILRYAPFSAKKARPVVDLVRGLSVNEALETLNYVPRRAAPALSKLIRSAVANAGQIGGVEAGELVLRRVLALVGPLKQGRIRWRPGPRGRACPIKKRTCHLEVVLETAGPGPSRRRRSKDAAAAGAQPAAKKESGSGGGAGTSQGGEG